MKQKLSYEDELKAKEAYVKGLLEDFGCVRPIVGMAQPEHYRNKVTAAFGYSKGKIVSGQFAEGTHRIVPCDFNPLEDKKADEIIISVRELCPSFKIRPYDEDRGTGLLRYVQVRAAAGTGQYMVTLVTASPFFPGKNNFVKVLREKHPEIRTIVQDVNTRTDSLVLSGRQKVLYGPGYIEDELCGMRFRISPSSFYQVNAAQTEKLYQKAIKYADLKGRETVLDAYSGVGTIGLIASPKAGRVISVELNPDAVRDAKINAGLNRVGNIDFVCADATKFIREMTDIDQRVDTVIMDPPRSGSTREFIESVSSMRPKRIIYVSCDPKTLARDLKQFTVNGYRMLEATPFDCFPGTKHVECVVLLSKHS